jgi:hypothetical protein
MLVQVASACSAEAAQGINYLRLRLLMANTTNTALLTAWKKQLLDGAAGLFGQPAQPDAKDAQQREAQLFEEIGRLKFELDWVKKKSAQLG